MKGTAQRGPVDCRTEGCGKNAECIREQAFFVCRCPPGTSGQPNIECHRGELNPHNITNTINIYMKCIQYKKAFIAELMQLLH